MRFTDGDLLVDYERRRVEVDGHEVHLTPIEYKILLLLIANRGKVLTHHYILKEVWGICRGRRGRNPAGVHGDSPQEDREESVPAAAYHYGSRRGIPV